MRLDVAEQGGAGKQPGAGGAPPARRDQTVWTRRHASIFSAVRLAASRFTRSWQLLLAVALGMLVAVVLICTVPLYDALISDLQLQQTINIGGPVARDVEVTAQSGGISAQVATQSQALMGQLRSQFIAPYTTSTPTYYTETVPMGMKQAGTHTYNIADVASSQVKFFGFDMATTAPHMRFLAGGPAAASGSYVPVYITKQFATDVGLVPGDHLVVTQFGGTDFGAKEIDLTVTVAGIYTPNDANETYWNGFTFDDLGTPTTPIIYPILMPVNAFFNKLAVFTQVSMTQHFVNYTRPETINTGNMASVLNDMGQLRAHVNGQLLTLPGVQQAGILTQLDTAIQNVQAQASLLTLPLYMIVAQVVGLALLFVAAMAGLLVEAQGQEIATLKSRGASGSQLLGTFTMQGLFLGILVALAGPFLAALLGLALLKWFVASNVLGTSGVSTSYFSGAANPSAVVLPAIVGALLGVGAVVFAAFQSARMDVLAFRREQGRASRAPFWRRYYLDVALAALCGVGYLELNQFGSVNTRQQLGSTSASPLLLVTPALLLLAGALLVLRVFPLGAALGARLAARGRGLTSLLAFAQVERNPQRYSRITLLLVLAVGLGLFALTFDSSLTQNTTDRATYTVGADVRLVQNFGEGNGRGAVLAGKIAQLPGVLGVSPVYRTLATSTVDQGNAQADLLG
ncbi:MAG: FtsX-like permease family protein, partial [Ktedonobacterales bacterium]